MTITDRKLEPLSGTAHRSPHDPGLQQLEGKELPGHVASAWVPAQAGPLDKPGMAHMQALRGGWGHAAGTVSPSRL